MKLEKIVLTGSDRVTKEMRNEASRRLKCQPEGNTKLLCETVLASPRITKKMRELAFESMSVRKHPVQKSLISIRRRIYEEFRINFTLSELESMRGKGIHEMTEIIRSALSFDSHYTTARCVCLAKVIKAKLDAYSEVPNANV